MSPKPVWSPADIVRPKRTIAVVEMELAAVTADRDAWRAKVDELAAKCRAAEAATNAVAEAVPALRRELALANAATEAAAEEAARLRAQGLAADKPAAGKNLRLVLKAATLAWLKEIAGLRKIPPAKAAEALLDELAADDLAAHARAAQ